MLNTKKQEPQNWIETQNNEMQNTTNPNTTEQTLTQEDKIKVKLIKKIKTEKKTITNTSGAKTGRKSR